MSALRDKRFKEQDQLVKQYERRMAAKNPDSKLLQSSKASGRFGNAVANAVFGRVKRTNLNEYS